MKLAVTVRKVIGYARTAPIDAAAEPFTQACGHCGEPIALHWDNGVILPPGVTLIADAVFHDVCWDKMVADDPP